jgi:hypothetical protein
MLGLAARGWVVARRELGSAGMGIVLFGLEDGVVERKERGGCGVVVGAE